ncbi:MAG: 1-acyl-sn-glycerol-3-phosphate acyltransferase [Bacilli bacterium]|nr:1-acyl-sn-glycerol-3-phosphate acyltransferase [Bacilli bacterium]
MVKLWKYLRIGLICGWRVLFEYLTWILPTSRHPDRTPLSVRYAKARSLIVFVLRHLVIDFKIDNLELLQAKEPTLFIGNHLSMVDALILIALSPRPVAFVSKIEARKIIVVGRLITCIDGVFLDREDPFQAVKAFRKVANNMKTEGVSYCVFPEGTRQRDPYSGKLLEFRSGSFKIAHMAKCPMVTFALFGTMHIFSKSPVRGHLIQIKGLTRYEAEEIAAKKTVELGDITSEEIAAQLPQLIAFDQENESQKPRHKAQKWWKALPKGE